MADKETLLKLIDVLNEVKEEAKITAGIKGG